MLAFIPHKVIRSNGLGGLDEVNDPRPDRLELDRVPGLLLPLDRRSGELRRALTAGAVLLGAAAAVAIVRPEAWVRFAGLAAVLPLVPTYLLVRSRGWSGLSRFVACSGAALVAGEAVRHAWFAPAGTGGWMTAAAAVSVLVTVTWAAAWDAAHRNRREALRIEYEDPLTKLPRRELVRWFAERQVAASRRRGTEFCVVLFRIEGLGRYRSEKGAAAADELLRRVGSILGRVTRDTEAVGRYGPQAFVSVLSATGREGAEAHARRVQRALAACPAPEGSMPGVSARVAVYDPSVESVDALFTKLEEGFRVEVRDRDEDRALSPGVPAATEAGRG